VFFIHSSRLAASIALLTLASYAGTAQGVDLITNGGFETGNFNGWTIASEFSATSYDNNVTAPASNFYIQNNSLTTPVSGLSTIGPATGNFYAIADSTTPGANVLIQNFTVPLFTTALSLSFDMFTYDWFGNGATGTSLNYLDTPNQHVRVDLLRSDAPNFDTSATYVLANIFDGLQTNTDPPAWQNYVSNLMPFVTPGSTYRLRFGAVDNQFVLNMGVDNVSLNATVIPEPSSVVLCGIASLALIARRRRSRKA
jgi:hypothetical protein